MDIKAKVRDVLDNTGKAKVLSGTVRVLNILPRDDKILLISLPRPKESAPSQTKDYVTGPFWNKLGETQEHLNDLHIHILNLDDDTQLPDAELLAQAETDEERTQITERLKRRDGRYQVIKPIVQRRGTSSLRSPAEIFEAKSTPRRIAARAAKLGCSRGYIYKLLHTFWAGGSQKNALITNHQRCGAPGKARAQQRKLGRQPNLYKANKGDSSLLGYVLDQNKPPSEFSASGSDRSKLAYGYGLISKEVRPYKAYLLTMAAFWAHHRIQPDGTRQARLFPKAERPSFCQFKYWGKRLNGDKSITRLLLGARKWDQQVGARGGSVGQQVANALQMLVMDSTTCDVFLTSLRSRLVKLPPLHRIVVKELRSDLIVGFYIGWRAPSQRTALLALHCAATSKISLCARFGIEVTDEQWPFGLAPLIQGDNGELKGSLTREAGEQFGFGIDIVPVFRGDKKGSIEGGHRSDHQKLDAEAPGYTGGGTHIERGEDHAALSALWTYPEYVRELLLQWIQHNTTVERPHLAPTEMIIAGIKPTPTNIFNWMREHGQTSELAIDTESLRAFCLPDVDAVIRKNGIYLKLAINGSKRILPRLRYSSDELVASGLMSEVRRTRHVLDVRVKMDEEDLSRAWLPTKKGMIPLHCTLRDSALLTKLTLAECTHMAEQDALTADLARGDVEQRDLDTTLRRRATTLNASKELREELAKQPRRPSKASMLRDLPLRAQQEEEELRLQDAGNKPDADPDEPEEEAPASSPRRPICPPDAAARAMQLLNEKELEHEHV